MVDITNPPFTQEMVATVTVPTRKPRAAQYREFLDDAAALVAALWAEYDGGVLGGYDLKVLRFGLDDFFHKKDF